MNSAAPTLIAKLTNRVRRTGLLATARYASIAAKHRLHYLLYDRRHDRLERHPTEGTLLLQNDDLAGPVGDIEQKRYQPAPRLVLVWALEALRINPTEYNFVDLGSGRGRILLTAARFPFRRVIGVEFSRSLHHTACENIAHYPPGRLTCGEVASVHADATEFDIPNGPCVIFMYNPFRGRIMERVAQRLEEAYRSSPRELLLIYLNSDRLPILSNRTGFRRLQPSFGSRAKLAFFANVPVEFFSIEPQVGNASQRPQPSTKEDLP